MLITNFCLVSASCAALRAVVLFRKEKILSKMFTDVDKMPLYNLDYINSKTDLQLKQLITYNTYQSISCVDWKDHIKQFITYFFRQISQGYSIHNCTYNQRKIKRYRRRTHDQFGIGINNFNNFILKIFKVVFKKKILKQISINQLQQPLKEIIQYNLYLEMIHINQKQNIYQIDHLLYIIFQN